MRRVEKQTGTQRGLRRYLVTCGWAFVLVFGLFGNLTEATEYFVAIDNPEASDSNNGLSTREPFKTLARGARELEPGDTLTIKKGIYREALVIGKDGTPSSPIVIRAYPDDEGEVVIRGSDVVNSWTKDGDDVWYVSSQPLPLIDYPPGYPDVDEYARRRELVFVDGERFTQVLRKSNLIDGSFWMDDDTKTMWIRYSGNPNGNNVEIAVRKQGVYGRGRSHIAIHGVRVEHVSTEIWIAAVALGPYCEVDNCRVEQNNGHGISVASNSVVKNSTSDHNGRLGIGLSGDNSLIDSCETSYNSWRYGLWAAGGIKFVSSGAASGNRIVHHTARFNNGPGIAFDTVGAENVIEASTFEGNKQYQISVEATIGPNWVINNLILSSTQDGKDVTGIRLLNARDTHIYNNTIVNVGGSCIRINGGERASGPLRVYAAGTKVFNNILSVFPGTRAIDFGVWGRSNAPAVLESHRFDNNLYYGADPLFWWQGPYTLSEWQANRGEDQNSISAPPLFLNPELQDYSLQIGSPAIDAGRNLPEVSADFNDNPRPQGLRTDIGAFERTANPPGSTRSPLRRVVP